MASKRRLRRRSCEGKAAHPTEAGAIIAARIMNKQKNCYYAKAYRCQFCGKWHIGRVNRKTHEAMKRRGSMAF